MDITDAEMIAAADRAERQYKARRAQTNFRAGYRAAAPRRPFVPRAPARVAPRPIRYAYAGAARVPPQEIKSFDFEEGANVALPLLTAATGSASLATGMVAINLVQQGAAYYNRIGTKAVVKSIAVQFGLGAPESYTKPGLVRYMVVYDRQPNGAYPTIGDILQNPAGNTFFNTGVNMTNKSRFSILRDKVVCLDAAQAAVLQVKEFISNRLETEYGTSTGGIGDIKSGAILLIIGYETIAEPAPTCFYPRTRIRYYD